MKRFLILIVAAIVVPAAGFIAGTHGVEAWQRWFRPDPLRSGDFRFVVETVGSPVVLLSTTTCPWCEKTRQWLGRHGVAYRDCIVDRDAFARSLLEQLNVETVPQLVTANAAVGGYDEALFGQVVGASARVPAHDTAASVRCEPPRSAAQAVDAGS